MNHDPSIRLPEACEACQQQLSELADSGAPLPADLQAHIDGCEECARFTARWLHGPPAVLAQPISADDDTLLRERILDAAVPPPNLPNIVQFPAPAARRAGWNTSLGRIAATVILGGFAYWLLNPVPTPPKDPAKLAGAPTLTQKLTQLEGRTKREQQVLQTALADGGREVQGNVAWSVSALEL